MGPKVKIASIRDHWRNLGNVVTAATGIVRLDQIDLGQQVLSIKPDGLFAVVGANGAGKSSFFDFLTSDTYSRIPFMQHQVELSGGVTLTIPGDTVPATLVDPYAELKRSNNQLLQYRSTFGQEEFSLIKDDERGIINYVLGSSYEKMQIEEVVVEDGEVCPRFVLSQRGQDMDNDSLSLGEQLVLYLYWLLARKYKSPGIFFLEEPEVGLSPAGQRRLVDLLAYLSADRKKQLFLATHSPFIIEALGKERVIVMKKPMHAEWTYATDINYLDELGMELRKKGIFFLEDNKARVFFEKLLDLYGSSLRKTFDIRFLSGETDVYEVVHRIGKRQGSLRVLGVLDADQKDLPKYQESDGTFYFLPGTLSPEREVINAITAHQKDYARAVGVPLNRLADAIRRCEGYEPHDFFEELSKGLFGVVKIDMYERAFGVWYANYENKEYIHTLMKCLDPDVCDEDIQAAEKLYL